MSAEYQFIAEHEENGCWMYEVDFLHEGKVIARHQLRLSWEDYDLWVPDGSIEPARVADAFLRYIQENEGFQPMPRKVDSSHPRRLDPGADDVIAGMIRFISR